MRAKRSGGRQAATGSNPKSTSPAGAGSYRMGPDRARSHVGAPPTARSAAAAARPLGKNRNDSAHV